MKVLFTFGGLPHYYNFVLSRLNTVQNLEIVVVVPQQKAGTFGNGVKQTHEGINFKVRYLKEKKAFYGNYILSGLQNLIEEEKPEIIVTIWPYILDFTVNLKLRNYLKINNIELILKEIPFKVPHKNKAIEYYKSKEYLYLNEDLKAHEKVNLKFKLKYHLLTWERSFYYDKVISATVNYIPQAKEIISSYGLPKEKIFIITNSPDTNQIFKAHEKIKKLPAILPDNKNRIVHIGRLVAWKKVHLLIDALVLLKKNIPDIELLVIGKGIEEEKLKQQVIQNNLEQNVRFVGAIYDNEILGQYLLSSQIYVLAGMGGLSINQAMAFGKPIICSTADGTEKALVKDGYSGYYFRDDDTLDLAQKIEQLLSQPEKIEKFGKNALEIIKNEINIHTVINGYLKAFNAVTNNQYALNHEISPEISF